LPLEDVASRVAGFVAVLVAALGLGPYLILGAHGCTVAADAACVIGRLEIVILFI
jgi:hypothetical protein